MKKLDLEMVRGDTLAFNLVFEEGVGDNVSSIIMTCRKRDTNLGYVFKKQIGDGVRRTDTNTYRVRVAPEDTETIASGTYVYDVEVGIGEDIYTILLGDLKIRQDVTYK